MWHIVNIIIYLAQTAETAQAQTERNMIIKDVKRIDLGKITSPLIYFIEKTDKWKRECVFATCFINYANFLNYARIKRRN